MADCVSRDEAVTFFQETLGVPGYEEKFSRDRMGVLREILIAWQGKVPFQTITQLALPPADRRAPSVQDCIKDVITLKGGRCWTQNSALCQILRAAGYDAYPVLSHVMKLDTNSHLIVIIRDLTSPGSRHLVDPAFGSVNPQVIDLAFQDETPVFGSVYTPYKYIKHSGWIVRCHQVKPDKKFLDQDGIVGTIIGDWMLMYYFKPEPEVTLENARKWLNDSIYTKEDHPFNNNIVCTIIPNGCFTFVIKKKLKFEKSPGGETDGVMLDTDDAIIDALRSHFPSLPVGEIKQALENLKLYQTTAGTF